MSKYIAKRLLWMIPVLLGVAILIFTIMYFTPGDPVEMLLGPEATAEQIAAKRAQMGLDKPFFVQMWNYLTDMFLRFDFGDSYVYGSPVINELLIRLPRTLTIGCLCMLLQICVGIPLGIFAATNHNRLGDRVSMFIALFGVSVPQFWLALMLVLVFAVELQWLPQFGFEGFEYYILPCIANSFAGIATQARQTRSSMLDVIRADYSTTARSKGMSERQVILKHALPNALIPVITILGNGFGMMLGGTVVIENIFTIPGIGSYLTQAIGNRDYPIIRSSVVLLALVFSLIMLLVDLIYAFVDPRIKAQYEGGGRRKKNG